MSRERGASLTGLMLTLSLAAIVLTLAAPGFSGLAAQARLQDAAGRLYTAVWYARSEAIMRGQRVVVAARSDGWAAGWRIFVDSNADGRQQSGERRLRTSAGPGRGIAIAANSGIGEAIHYRPDGQTRRPSGSLQMGTIRLCQADARGERGQRRAIIVNATGRPRLATSPGQTDGRAC